MKKTCIIAAVLLMVAVIKVGACEAPSYLLFREDAQARLDSLNQHQTDENLFERIVLMHNLAFHKNKEMREEAEKLLKKNFSHERQPIVDAYVGSLKMIKVSHRSTLSKAFGSIFGSSPYDQARQGFKLITDALEKDPTNSAIRILRATAATESAEYLPELLGYAAEDLAWLAEHTSEQQSALMFFINLTWCKYYYKQAYIVEDPQLKKDYHDKALEFVRLADEYVCCELYCQEQYSWEHDKIGTLEIE